VHRPQKRSETPTWVTDQTEREKIAENQGFWVKLYAEVYAQNRYARSGDYSVLVFGRGDIQDAYVEGCSALEYVGINATYKKLPVVSFSSANDGRGTISDINGARSSEQTVTGAQLKAGVGDGSDIGG
jgi:hypothetical protein